jgi:hypothetical protein
MPYRRLQLRHLALGAGFLVCCTEEWFDFPKESCPGHLTEMIDLSTLETFHCLNEPMPLSSGRNLRVNFYPHLLLQATNLRKIYVGLINGGVEMLIQALTAGPRKLYELEIVNREDMYYRPMSGIVSGWRKIQIHIPEEAEWTRYRVGELESLLESPQELEEHQCLTHPW